MALPDSKTAPVSFRLAPARPSSPTRQALRPPSPPILPRIQWLATRDPLDLRHRSLHYSQPFLYASHRGFLEAQRFLHEAFQSHLRALISCHALLLSRHSDPSRRITKPLRTLTRHLAALLALLLPSLNRLARTAVEASAVAKDLRNREEGREKRLGRLLERFEVGRKRWEGVEQWGEAYRAWLDGAKKELWSALVVPNAPATKESATRAVEHLCDTEWDLRSAIHAFTVSFSSETLSSWSDALLYGGRSAGRIEGWLRVAEVAPAASTMLRAELRELMDALMGRETEKALSEELKRKDPETGMPCGPLDRWGCCGCDECEWRTEPRLDWDVYRQ